MTSSGDTRPTVCQVLHSLGIGGAEMLAMQIAQRLSDRFRFVFACLDDLGTWGEQLRDSGFPVEVLQRQPGIDWRCAFRLGHFLRRERVTVVHAHQYTPFFQSLLARLAYRRPPVIFTEHGRHYPDSRSLKRVAFNRVLLRGDDRVIGVGQAVCDALIQNEGLPSQRVELIYNGVDLGAFAAAADRADECRVSQRNCDALSGIGFQPVGVHQVWQKNDRQDACPAKKYDRQDAYPTGDEFRPTILQVARLNPLKDHETALRAFARLRDQGVKARLVLAGEGETRPVIERCIADLKLEQDVTLLGARRDIPELMAAADVFLLSSISEGIPLTLIEAMAARRPVVSTDVGGVSEVVLHNETGLLAPARDDEQLARHLRTLIKSPELRSQFGTAGSRRAHELFSIEQMLESYAELYGGGPRAEGRGRKAAFVARSP